LATGFAPNEGAACVAPPLLVRHARAVRGGAACDARDRLLLQSATMQTLSSRTRSEASDAELLHQNRRFYDTLWSGAHLVEPHHFNTWPLVQSLLPGAPRRLEVAPGLRPRMPIEGTQFVDISAPALAQLRERGAQVVLGQVTALPFADASFDIVCTLDIVEHVDDEDGALSELSRVAKPGATLLISLPLHPSRWNAFDDFVGHKRRYEPQRLLDKLNQHHFAIERSAVYGMQPSSSRLLDMGMWWLTNHREHAMWWYNKIFLPLGLRFQKELQIHHGAIDMDQVDEVLLVCRRAARPVSAVQATAEAMA
jgi:SAM-dependent methyltransferase